MKLTVLKYKKILGFIPWFYTVDLDIDFDDKTTQDKLCECKSPKQKEWNGNTWVCECGGVVY